MKERVLTALVLFATVVGVLFFDSTGFLVSALVLLVTFLGAGEMEKLVRAPDYSIRGTAFIFLVPVVLNKELPISSQPSWIVFPLCSCAIGLLFLLVSKTLERAWLSALAGTFLLGGAMSSVLVLGLSKTNHWPLLLLAAMPIWCGDTAAIFAGKAYGKHKLAPTISPNKTWEGAIANVVACVAMSFLCGTAAGLPFLAVLLVGLNCGIIGQAGDLFESSLKRSVGLKDSGTLLPGHGGVLDRMDSLLATAPISVVILHVIR